MTTCFSRQSCCFYWIIQYLLRPVSYLRTIFVSSGYHDAYRCCCWLHPWISTHTAGVISVSCLAVLVHWASKIAIRQCHHVFHLQLGATLIKLNFSWNKNCLTVDGEVRREILSLSYVLFFCRGARTSLLLLHISRIIWLYLIFCFPFLFSFFLSFLPSSLFPFLLFFLLYSLFPSIPPSLLSSFSVCLLFLHVLFLRNGS